MSGAIPWKLLKEQYLREGIFGKELSRMIHSPERVGFAPLILVFKEFY